MSLSVVSLAQYRSILHPTSRYQGCLLLCQLLYMSFFQTPPLTLTQSKECQKLHWKVTHKAICLLQTQKLNQNLGEDPDEKAKAKKVNRWINAWSPSMTECLFIALDLANHQWGLHETHTHVHLPASAGCC